MRGVQCGGDLGSAMGRSVMVRATTSLHHPIDTVLELMFPIKLLHSDASLPVTTDRTLGR